MSPKEIFNKHHPEAAKELAELLSQAWFKQACAYTLAEMAAKEPAVRQIQEGFPPIPGANVFLKTLEGMVAEEKPLKSPDDALLSYERLRATGPSQTPYL